MKTIKTIVFGPVKLKLKADGTARFFYSGSSFDFECSMFCEVGEPFKPYFDTLLKDNGLKICGQKEYEVSPWLADVVSGN